MLDTLTMSPTLFLILITLLGLVIGSFLNVVIARLPVMLQKGWYEQCKLFLSENYQINLQPDKRSPQAPFNLMLPRSQCPSCKTSIKIWDNIPIMSFLLLKGKCRSCQTRIPLRYPLVECFTALLSVLTAYHFGLTSSLLPGLLLTWALITLTMIDLDQQILPDNITLPFLWLGLLVNIQDTFCTLPQAILGAVLGYLILWFIYWIFKLITGKEGMGYGDFKLLAMLGAWVGVTGLLPIILISSFIGAITGITLILLKKHEKGHPIPFGPFLAGAGWIVFLYGDKIISYYFSLTGMTAT